MIESLQMLFGAFVGVILTGVFFVGLVVRAQQIERSRRPRGPRARHA